MANYPSSIVNFPALADGVDFILASHQNTRGDEIEALESTLGINVHGPAADLVTRLERTLEEGANIQSKTTSGNLVLTDADKVIQKITLDANRDITLPSGANTNHAYLLSIVSGGFTATIKQPDTTIIASIPLGGSMYVVPLGSGVWSVVPNLQPYVSGSAPATPFAGQLWWDVTNFILWVYGNFGGGNRWISTNKYMMGFSSGAAARAATTFVPMGHVMSAGFDIFISQIIIKVHPLTTNNGSNFWSYVVRKVSGATVPAAGAGTSLGSATTSALSINSWQEVTANILAVIDFSGSGIELPFVDITQTGAPGNIWDCVTLAFRYTR